MLSQLCNDITDNPKHVVWRAAILYSFWGLHRKAQVKACFYFRWCHTLYVISWHNPALPFILLIRTWRGIWQHIMAPAFNCFELSRSALWRHLPSNKEPPPLPWRTYHELWRYSTNVHFELRRRSNQTSRSPQFATHPLKDTVDDMVECLVDRMDLNFPPVSLETRNHTVR